MIVYCSVRKCFWGIRQDIIDVSIPYDEIDVEPFDSLQARFEKRKRKTSSMDMDNAHIVHFPESHI